MAPSTSGKHIVVVGAGIVGVCSALYLQRAGFRVTLTDRGEVGEGAPFGNGAIIGGLDVGRPPRYCSVQ